MSTAEVKPKKPKPHNDGGSAFPNAPALPMSSGKRTGLPGMSLRDYFAGQALTMLGGRAWDQTGQSGETLIGLWATNAYRIADAMLAERSKPSS